MFGPQPFDLNADLRRRYAEMEVIAELKLTKPWKDFKALLILWVREQDEKVGDLAPKIKKDANETEILYRLAMRNSWMRMLDAIESTVSREPDVRERINKLETIRDEAR